MFSLSKGYNMTGWRCAAIVGNAEAIAHYWRLKSNIDSGLFEAVQLAGAAALRPELDAEVRAMNAVYAAAPRPGLRRARAGRRARHPAEGHDLHLGADTGGFDLGGRLLRARARAGAVVISPGGAYGAQRRGLLPDLADDSRRSPARGGGADPRAVAGATMTLLELGR